MAYRQDPILMQTANITLTNAQIKGMFVTPVQVIPAPGAGKIIVVVAWGIKLVYGGTSAFTGGGQTILCDVGLEQVATPANVAVLSGTTNQYNFKACATSGANTEANYQNSAIYVRNDTGAFTGNAANDNTAIVNVTYYILTM